jgi:hypothetical protein
MCSASVYVQVRRAAMAAIATSAVVVGTEEEAIVARCLALKARDKCVMKRICMRRLLRSLHVYVLLFLYAKGSARCTCDCDGRFKLAQAQAHE